MDKIPLIYSSEPRRGDVEYDTIKKVICPRNIIETELFLLIFREETQHFFDTIDHLNISRELDSTESIIRSTKKGQLNVAVQYVNKLLVRPLSPSIIYDALMARCIYNISKNKYMLSLKDIIFCKQNINDVGVNKNIIFLEIIFCYCSYIVRNLQDAFNSFKSLQKMSTPELLQSCYYDPDIRPFLLLVDKYKSDILNIRNNVKFKMNPIKMDYLTAKFQFVKEQKDKRPGFYASSFIRKGDIVFREDFNCFYFSTPFLNCDLCGVHSKQLYTCRNCSYKTYCSNKCLTADKDDHSIECIAYQMPILPMLEATQLYRLFVRSMRLLANAMSVTSNSWNKCMTVAEVWDFIMKYVVAEKPYDALIIELLKNKPNYNQLSEDQWQKTISTSFRLSVFLYKLTNLKDMCFSDFGLLKDDIIIMNAAIFMRLKANILLKSVHKQLYYKVENNDNHLAETEEFHLNEIGKDEQKERINANIFGYCDINASNDFADICKKLSDSTTDLHDKNDTKIERKAHCCKADRASPIAEFINNIFNVCLMSDEIKSTEELLINKHAKMDVQIIKEWNTSKRCDLVRKLAKYFHTYLTDYFLTLMRKHGILHQQKSSICLKFKSLNHSCDGNVELRTLENGEVVGIAVSNIKFGSELTASHGVNHMVHTREERQAYFKNLGFVCVCSICTRSVMLEITNAQLGLFCSCDHRNEINPSSVECVECHTKYVELKYSCEIFISTIEEEIKAQMLKQNSGAPRDLAILFGAYNSFINTHFNEYHTLRLEGILKYAKFLAMNGFYKNACDVIYSLRRPIQDGDICIELRYVGKFYSEVFTIIKIIFKNYIESACYILESFYPNMLLSIALVILDKQNQRLQLCLDDEQAFALLEDHRTSCSKWRQITSAHLLMSPKLRSWLLEP